MSNKIQTATNGANGKLVAQNGGKVTMADYIKKMESAIRAALPTTITPERFTRIVFTALSSNPTLQKTTPESFIGAMMQAAQLGLEPNTQLGQAYLIPYYSNKKKAYECSFQLGYKGLIDLAYRSGQVVTIQAHVVYENDDFIYSFGLEPELKHVPARTDRGEPIYVYGMFRTKDGGYGFEVMSMDDIRTHGTKHSKTYENGPWVDNFEEMAKKTVIKKALKYAPLKSEFMRGISSDETIKTELSEDMSMVSGSTIIDDNNVIDGEYTEYETKNTTEQVEDTAETTETTV